VFDDGLGKRHHAKAPSGELLEVLELRQELATDGFESALRERIAALAGLHTTWFSHVRTVQRIKQKGAALFVVYDRVAGTRLSTVLAARQPSAPIDLKATLDLIRQLAAAIALLHEKLPGVAHGAISSERVIVTPDARVVVADHVFGSALEQLHYTPAEDWHDLHVALPGDPPAFDPRADVMQIGTLALELILGRRIETSEYPHELEALTEQVWRSTSEEAVAALPTEFRAWLLRMLQFDPRHAFASAVDAWADLEDMLGGRDNGATFVALESVMADYATGADATSADATSADATSADETSADARAEGAGPAPAETASPAASVESPIDDAPVAAEPPSHTDEDATEVVAVPGTPPPLSTSEATPEPPSEAVFARRIEPEVAPVERADDPVERDHVPVERELAWAARDLAPVEPDRAWVERDLAPVERDRAFVGFDTTPVGFGAATRDDVKAAAPPTRTRWMVAAAVLVLLAGAAFGRQYLLPTAAAEAPGTLVVTTNPAGYEVFVDGQPRGVTPLTLELTPGAHELKIATEGEPRIIPFTVAAGSSVAQSIEIPKAVPVTGQLMVHTEPAGARVMIDDTLRGTTPLTIEGLTPGTLSVTLQNDLSSVTQQVTIEPGVRASLVVPMTPPQGVPVSGWVSVVAPSEVQVYEDGRLLGSSQSDRIMVSAGPHTLEIVSEPLGYRVKRTITVVPGKVSPVRLEWPNGSLALNAQPWAEVWVNGKPLGETPIGGVEVPIGIHEVIFRHPQLGEQVVRATVTATAPARVTVDLRKQ
jgi:cation transport regulator ChaB